MTVPDRALLLQALNTIKDPVSGLGLADAGQVKGLMLAEGRAGFMLEVPAAHARAYAAVRDQAEALLAGMTGIERARVVLTTETAGPAPAPRRGARLSREAVEQGRPPAPVASERPAFVRHVVAVGSGKGGVGKSTVAVSLACALQAKGLSVGLLDADVYGPSIPTMLGLDEAPRHADGQLQPLHAFGLKAMSVGLLVEADQAMVWRGPMASQALTQMLTQTAWGTAGAPLDVLIVDLPPGTGDVQLTLIQKTPLDGAIIVSTPQEVALADARRAHGLFTRTRTPVLGLIETLSWLEDPATGARQYLFGEGGGRDEAARLGIACLAQIPIDIRLRQGGDEGRPLVATDPASPTARLFAEAADRVWQALQAAKG